MTGLSWKSIKLRAKQMAFDVQHMALSLIRKTPLDAAACKEAFCFAAGTLVHTKEGLLPIEQIKVGDWVLSKHENGEGEQAYKRVTRTIKSEDVSIGFMRYYSDTKVEHVRVTGNHPFYVKRVGWIQSLDVSHPDKLESYDGTPLGAWEWGSLWGTGTEGVAIVFSCQTDRGTVIDFREGDGVVVDSHGHRGMSDDTEWRATVYNIEVEQFHTYYVGELGVWVRSRNSGGTAHTGMEQKGSFSKDGSPNSPQKTLLHANEIADGEPVKAPGEALPSAQSEPFSDTGVRVPRTDMETAGFDGEIFVIVEGGRLEHIEYIDLGTLVLSRCEKTGETAYRKVLKHLRRHHVPVYDLWCRTVGSFNEQPILTTAEHPFWVKGKGWTPVVELQRGDVLENKDGTQTTVWGVEKRSYFCDVHNLEVEEFNTYFVGECGYWVHAFNSPELQKDS